MLKKKKLENIGEIICSIGNPTGICNRSKCGGRKNRLELSENRSVLGPRVGSIKSGGDCS